MKALFLAIFRLILPEVGDHRGEFVAEIFVLCDWLTLFLKDPALRTRIASHHTALAMTNISSPCVCGHSVHRFGTQLQAISR
jgi:hypothetical protein